MGSNLRQPFTEKEKEELEAYPNCNSLLQRLMPGIYDKLDKEDYRLINVIGGDRLIIHDRGYPGKGVKKMDLRLNESGIKILADWRKDNGRRD